MIGIAIPKRVDYNFFRKKKKKISRIFFSFFFFFKKKGGRLATYGASRGRTTPKAFGGGLFHP